MSPMNAIGRILILLGVVLVVMGVVLLFGPKIPVLGKLPGDISIERKGYALYVPITTCVLISIVLTLLMWLLGRK